MNIILILLTIILAAVFLLISSKFKISWIKKSFILYGTVFTSLAFILTATWLYDERYILEEAFAYFDPEPTTITPPEPLLSSMEIKDSVRLDVPSISQLPELPRGCEVTSLAMLLHFHGVKVDKMELAEQIIKVPYKSAGKHSHPNDGFVGDMYNFQKPGLGVYHDPIMKLATKYIDKDQIENFSGDRFSKIIEHLNHNRPVWVIINADYKKLPDSSFQTWETEKGPIEITRRLHSVVVTGYDEDYIYFNDPLNRVSKAPYNDFKEAWIQMGRQALTIL